MRVICHLLGWRRRFWGLIVGRKCIECGRRFRLGFDEDLCSRECFDRWFPF